MRGLLGWLRNLSLWLGLGLVCATASQAAEGPRLYYHVFVRSFADSNGDRIGDLPGLAAHLDYLSQLHVTHVLLTPVQTSPFYHNYFATDFDGVDPAYGGAEGWDLFLRAAHRRGMKVILDEEFQYVAEGHPWWRDQEGAPGKPEGQFVLWNSPQSQTNPEPFLNRPRYTTHDGRSVGIAMVNLNRAEVRAAFLAMLQRRVDPRGEGGVVEGVDGFRIDHMMDDLDGKHRVTGLLSKFWAPTISALKHTHPDLEFIGEQWDWGDGRQFLTQGGADAVFAFPLRAALVRLDKAAIVQAIKTTQAATPKGKRQLTFLENHDVDRFASRVGSDPRKLVIGAALDLTLGNDPIIYYGQELGMRGVELHGKGSDGAQIPLREAFRWRSDLEAQGSAIWYQGDQPWWTQRANRSGDGVSVEEEEAAPQSLLSFYRWLTTLRTRRPELAQGELKLRCRDPGPVLCYVRRMGSEWMQVAVNLSDHPASFALARPGQAYDLRRGGRISGRWVRLAPWGLALVGSPTR